MRELISSERMSAIDRRAQAEYGIPQIVLMENAGLKGWQFINSWGEIKNTSGLLLFAAGPGNNGGDCLVMARHAFEIYPDRVKVILSSKMLHETAALQLEIIEKMGAEILFWTDDRVKGEEYISNAFLIVDGLFGTGLKGALREGAAELVSAINNSSARTVSADIPSGLYDQYKTGDPCIYADLTLVFGLPRYAHFLPGSRTACGGLHFINPGFPSRLLTSRDNKCFLLSFEDFTLPEVEKSAYKNKRGHTALFAGSVGFTGAAVLSAQAALRSRTGLVTLHVDRDIYSAVAPALASVMVRPIEEGDSGMQYLGRFSAFLAGPGWGIVKRLNLLKDLLESSLPGVIDADGIREMALLGKEESSYRCAGKDRVITPHPGELSVLTGISKKEILEDPFTHTMEAAREFNTVVVLKSYVVYICTPDGKTAVVDGMNPAMGTGGSGDVLSGIIAGLLSQGLGAFDSAVNGTLLHQEAGRRCFEGKGWFASEDLLEYISVISMEAGF